MPTLARAHIEEALRDSGQAHFSVYDVCYAARDAEVDDNGYMTVKLDVEVVVKAEDVWACGH